MCGLCVEFIQAAPSRHQTWQLFLPPFNFRCSLQSNYVTFKNDVILFIKWIWYSYVQVSFSVLYKVYQDHFVETVCVLLSGQSRFTLAEVLFCVSMEWLCQNPADHTPSDGSSRGITDLFKNCAPLRSECFVCADPDTGLSVHRGASIPLHAV
jgi:hypothetical protein